MVSLAFTGISFQAWPISMPASTFGLFKFNLMLNYPNLGVSQARGLAGLAPAGPALANPCISTQNIFFLFFVHYHIALLNS